MIGRRGFVTAMAFAAGLALAACAAPPPPPPPPPPPTIVDLTIVADPGLNPSPDGRPSPVLIRVYRLATPSKFERADFFQLYDNAATALGADLVGAEEVMIAPGETKTLRQTFEDNARYLGVFVAYRDFDRANWRAIAAIPPNETRVLRVRLLPLAARIEP